jgi:hypothetical protein
VEEEIERLEEQVKEIEAESREHNRTSSTQDGMYIHIFDN